MPNFSLGLRVDGGGTHKYRVCVLSESECVRTPFDLFPPSSLISQIHAYTHIHTHTFWYSLAAQMDAELLRARDFDRELLRLREALAPAMTGVRAHEDDGLSDITDYEDDEEDEMDEEVNAVLCFPPCLSRPTDVFVLFFVGRLMFPLLQFVLRSLCVCVRLSQFASIPAVGCESIPTQPLPLKQRKSVPTD